MDNASPDGSGERLRASYPSVDYLQTGENLGYAGGNNRGIEWALARGAVWVLVVNNDTVAEPDCVRLLFEAASGDGCLGAVAPLIVRHDDPDRVWFAGGRLSRLRAMGVHRGAGARVADATRAVSAAPGCECSFLCGCCVLFRAAALREVGAFRDDFFSYVEDVDLSYRLGGAGWKLAWVPAARLAHRVPAHRAAAQPLQIRLRDRNRRRMVRDLYPLPLRLAFALWFWPTRLMHLVRHALAGDRARARAVLAGMFER